MIALVAKESISLVVDTINYAEIFISTGTIKTVSSLTSKNKIMEKKQSVRFVLEETSDGKYKLLDK